MTHCGKHIFILEKSGERYAEPDGVSHSAMDLVRYYRRKSFRGPVMFEERIECHPELKKLSPHGTMSDFRFYLFDGKIRLSEIRIPTKASRGYGNVARKCILVFIDDDGRFFNSPYIKGGTTVHPDIGDLNGWQVPCWKKTLDTLLSIPPAFGTPEKMTVDGTIDENGDFAILEIHTTTALIQYLTDEGRKWWGT
jgi:hypothetical protein